MNNKGLLLYISGVVSAIVVAPVLEEFTNLACAYIQSWTIKPAKNITQGQKEINDMNGEEYEEKTPCIGFSISNECDCEE